MRYGIPQGSPLGPLLFTVYALPLGDIIKRHDTNYKVYADDNELYNSIQYKWFSISEWKTALKQWVTSCSLIRWKNYKLDFMLIGTSTQLKKLNFTSIQIGNSFICSLQTKY